MERKTASKALIRRKQIEIERERERGRLLETFIHGYSNIDYTKIPLEERGELIWEMTEEEKRACSSRSYPLISREQWIEDKLQEFDKNQPQYPKGKYQDENEIYVKIQQTFFKALRDSSPHVFDDFKLLLPKFRKLFGTSGNKYYEIIRDLKINLTILASGFPNYEPRKDENYLWENTKLIFAATQYTLDSASSDEPAKLQIPKEIIEARQQAGDNFEWFWQTLGGKISALIGYVKTAFEDKANDDAVLRDFVSLQIYLNDWADRHHLPKDWLIEYAYFFLYQMSQNEHLPISEIAIFPLHFNALRSHDFDFTFRGWVLAKEDVDDYEDELRNEFEMRLLSHLSQTFSVLRLDEKITITKPKDFESIKWLIAWNEGATMKQIADFFSKSSSTIDSGIDNLKQYDLPKRKGKRGRKQTLLSQERLAKIKAIKIDENLFDE